MVRCNNCGAKISKNDTECPYCHASQFEASERKYINNLYKLNDRLDKEDDKAFKFLTKKTIIYFAVTFAVIGLAIALGILVGYNNYKRYHDSNSRLDKINYSMNWYDANIDQLNSYVSTGKYKEAADCLDSYKGEREVLQNWEHYVLVVTYSDNYLYFEKLLQDKNLFNNNKCELNEYEFETLFSNGMYCLSIVNMTDEISRVNRIYIPDEDKQVLQKWAGNAEKFFLNVVGVNKETYIKDMKEIYLKSYCDYQIEQNIYKKYYNLYLSN